LLLLFRKQKFTKEQTDVFYDNIIDFAERKTSNRGSASGSKSKNMKENPKIMTNIFGFYEKFNPKQKIAMSKNKIKLIARECYFNIKHPEQYKKVIPFVQKIDEYYKKYIPDKYALQKKKATQTFFKIPQTSFTTVTTNVNYRTSIHKDKGDDPEGFGNLVVIEKGKYTGGEFCLPQYGVGVNMKNSDILFVDVHKWHGNLPIHLVDKDAKRLSIVCYLRHNLWNATKNKTHKFMTTQLNQMRTMMKHETINDKTQKNKTKKNKTQKNKTVKRK